MDHRAGDEFRVVSLTPVGSGCSITLMRDEQAAGSLQGLHLVVRDIDEADDSSPAPAWPSATSSTSKRACRVEGPDPGRADYGSFLSFSDPDGNGWTVQEVPSRDR